MSRSRSGGAQRDWWEATRVALTAPRGTTWRTAAPEAKFDETELAAAQTASTSKFSLFGEEL